MSVVKPLDIYRGYTRIFWCAVQLQDSEFVYVPDTYVMAIYGLLGPETKVQRVRSYYVRTYGLSFDIAL